MQRLAAPWTGGTSPVWGAPLAVEARAAGGGMSVKASGCGDGHETRVAWPTPSLRLWPTFVAYSSACGLPRLWPPPSLCLLPPGPSLVHSPLLPRLPLSRSCPPDPASLRLVSSAWATLDSKPPPSSSLLYTSSSLVLFLPPLPYSHTLVYPTRPSLSP